MDQAYGAMRTTLNMSRYHSRKVNKHLVWARISVGREARLQREGRRFESCRVHHLGLTKLFKYGYSGA
jgi:hypothetical protein